MLTIHRFETVDLAENLPAGSPNSQKEELRRVRQPPFPVRDDFNLHQTIHNGS